MFKNKWNTLPVACIVSKPGIEEENEVKTEIFFFWDNKSSRFKRQGCWKKFASAVRFGRAIPGFLVTAHLHIFEVYCSPHTYLPHIQFRQHAEAVGSHVLSLRCVPHRVCNGLQHFFLVQCILSTLDSEELYDHIVKIHS